MPGRTAAKQLPETAAPAAVTDGERKPSRRKAPAAVGAPPSSDGASEAHSEQVPESVVDIERTWIDMVLHLTAPAFGKRVIRESGSQIPRRAYYLLIWLNEWGPTQVSTLAQSTGVDISTMSRSITQLEKKGLIARIRLPNVDQRSVFVQTTAKGTRAMARERAARQQALAEIVRDWSEADRKALARLYRRLSDSIRDYGERASEDNGARAVDLRWLAVTLAQEERRRS